MSALNSLPLPVVRLLAFFHEELAAAARSRAADRATLGRLPAGDSDLDDFNPFCGVRWQCCFTVFSRTRFTPNLSRSCCGCHGAGDRQPVFNLQMVIRQTRHPIDHRRANPDGLRVLMRTHRLGLVFRRRHCRYLRANLPAMLDYPEVVVRLTLWCIVVAPVSNLADDVNRRAVVSQSCHFAIRRRLMIGLMMPLVT